MVGSVCQFWIYSQRSVCLFCQTNPSASWTYFWELPFQSPASFCSCGCHLSSSLTCCPPWHFPGIKLTIPLTSLQRVGSLVFWIPRARVWTLNVPQKPLYSSLGHHLMALQVDGEILRGRTEWELSRSANCVPSKGLWSPGHLLLLLRFLITSWAILLHTCHHQDSLSHCKPKIMGRIDGGPKPPKLYELE